jgi:hypothetical protein
MRVGFAREVVARARSAGEEIRDPELDGGVTDPRADDGVEGQFEDTCGW